MVKSLAPDLPCSASFRRYGEEARDAARAYSIGSTVQPRRRSRANRPSSPGR
jgi:hypothetical protein